MIRNCALIVAVLVSLHCQEYTFPKGGGWADNWGQPGPKLIEFQSIEKMKAYLTEQKTLSDGHRFRREGCIVYSITPLRRKKK